MIFKFQYYNIWLLNLKYSVENDHTVTQKETNWINNVIAFTAVKYTIEKFLMADV